MDGLIVKSEFVGFKCTPELRFKLTDAASRKGITLSKLVCYILMDYFRSGGDFNAQED